MVSMRALILGDEIVVLIWLLCVKRVPGLLMGLM